MTTKRQGGEKRCEGLFSGLDGHDLCCLLLMEDVDSRTVAIRIKPGPNQRTKAYIVGRNSTSAFEKKHEEASSTTATAERCL